EWFRQIFFSLANPFGQPARWLLRITLVEKSEKAMIERKKITSRESSTPFWNPSKWVMKLSEVMVSTSHCQDLAQPDKSRMTGGKPANSRKRQSTTEIMKLTTWVRVMAEVMQLIAK